MIDLHTHSDQSDGTQPPVEIARAAAKRGVSLWALTDHDTISGLDEAAKEAAALGVPFVCGVEISAKQHDYLHILGLGVNPRDEKFRQILADASARREARIHKALDQLAATGLDLTFAEVRARAKGNLSRAHLADLLKAKGYAATRRDAFRKYLDPGKAGYVPSCGLDACEAITAIKNAGGAAVIAHPGLVFTELDLPAWKTAGLAGLEAYYPSHSVEMTRRLIELAHKYELIVTVGSDYHGPNSGRHPNVGIALHSSEEEAIKKSLKKFIWNT